MEPIPRAAVWVARGHFALVVLGLAAGGITAIAMRLAHWSPAGAGDGDGYNRLFSLHGVAMIFMVLMPAMFGMLANLVVPEAMRARTMPTIGIAAVGLLVWAIGATSLAVRTLVADPGWTFYTPDQARGLGWIAPALIMLGVALTFVHYVVVAVANHRRAEPLAIVVVIGVLAPMGSLCADFVQAIITYVRDPWTGPLEQALGVAFAETMHVDVIAALATITHLTSRELGPAGTWPRRAAAGLAGIAIWYFVTSHWVVGTLGLGGMTTLVALWFFAIRRTRGWHDPLALAIGFGVAPMLLLFGAARMLLTNITVDVHIHDTWFVLGTFHLGAAIVGLAWIAGLLVWSVPLFHRHARVWPARVGVVLVGVGVLVQSFTMLQLGNAGMPRRYATYVPQFTDMHRTTSIAAFVVAIGAVILVAAFVAGRRDDHGT